MLWVTEKLAYLHQQVKHSQFPQFHKTFKEPDKIIPDTSMENSLSSIT